MKPTAQVLAVVFALIARAFGRDYSRTTISCGTTGAPLFRNADAMMLAIVEHARNGNIQMVIRIALHGKVDPSISHIIPNDDARVFVESLKENNARGSRPVIETEIIDGTEIVSMEMRLAKNGGTELVREDMENRARVTDRLDDYRKQYPL